MSARIAARAAAAAIAVGLVVTSGGSAFANRGAYVTGNVPSDGSWVIINVYMYHDPWAGDEVPGRVQVTDNVRYGMGIGMADTHNFIYDGWQHIVPGDTLNHMFLSGYWYTTASKATAMVHPAAMMWGDGCGFVAPWDSCDVHFQANYWGFGWTKTW
jgi:hypothetical protein